MCTNYYQNS